MVDCLPIGGMVQWGSGSHAARLEGVPVALPLLQTKLYIPALRADLVPRPHLVACVEDSVRAGCALTLVAAPAGYGKTTLVATWARHSALAAAWLSLDEEDNDPLHFWTHVVAALRTRHSRLGEAVLAALQSPHPPLLAPLLTALLNDLAALPEALVLVLDDITPSRTRRSIAS